MIRNCSVCKKPCDETNSFTSSAGVTVHFECFDAEIAKTPDDPRPNWFIIFGKPLIISTLTAGACFFSTSPKSATNFVYPFLGIFALFVLVSLSPRNGAGYGGHYGGSCGGCGGGGCGGGD